jgi:hypothetical protein
MTDKETLKLAHGYLDRLIKGLNMDDTSEAVQVRDAIKQALAAPVQGLPFGVGGGLVAIKTLLSRDPCVHANTAIEMIDAILKEHPAAPVQDTDAHYKGVVEGVQKLFDDKRAQPAPVKPVAWDRPIIYTPPHMAPPAAKRLWVGLTDDEIYDSYNEPRSDSEMVAFARKVEAKLKERNQ